MLTPMLGRSLGIAVVLGLAGALPLAAQGRPLGVSGVRPLTFGTVLPGVPYTIFRTDAVNSGRFDLTGTRDAEVEMTFTLPPQMTGPAGATMPLVFGGNDAGYSETQSVGSQVGFDPAQAFRAQLSRNGRGAVFLGGTANPGPAQRAGAYTATVTLSVAYTGL